MKNFLREGAKKEAEYLHAAEMVCLAIMRFIKKHSEKVFSLAEKETDEVQKEAYLKIAKICRNIAKNSPVDFHEAVQ